MLKKLLVIIALLTVTTFAGDYVVIVNKGNSVSSIDKATLKRLFTGRIKKLGGAVAVPINQDLGSASAKAFLNDIVGKSPEAYKEYWVAQQIKGAGSAPMIQQGDAAIVGMVSSIPGAISYVAEASVTDAVKIIPVQ